MVKLFDAHIPMTISSNGALLCYTTASAGWMTNTPRFSSPTVSALSYFSSAGLSHSKYAPKSMLGCGAIYLDKPARLIRLLFGFVSDSVFQYLSSSIKIKTNTETKMLSKYTNSILFCVQVSWMYL